MPNARSLNAERFFGEPAEALTATAAYFGRPADAPTIAALTAGPLFNTYSKNPAHAFDNAARLRRKDHLAVQLSGEIAEAERWIGANASDAAVVERAVAAVAI
jgi:hypothetical protein